MKYFEFGKQNPELMVVLHGGGTSYRSALPTVRLLSQTYHVVQVAYDGFNPSEPETEFVSVQDEAKRLGDYIVSNYGGKIDILYGISYGCRVLMEVLQDERLSITTTIADGMPTREYPDIHSRLLRELYLFAFTGTFFVIMGRAGKHRKRFLARITGRSIEEAERVLYTKASWKSWKHQDECLIGYHTNYAAFRRTDMFIWHGMKSAVEKKLAKHMDTIREKGYPFTYKVFHDVGHGGLAGEHPERFLREVSKAHAHSLQIGGNHGE